MTAQIVITDGSHSGDAAESTKEKATLSSTQQQSYSGEGVKGTYQVVDISPTTNTTSVWDKNVGTAKSLSDSPGTLASQTIDTLDHLGTWGPTYASSSSPSYTSTSFMGTQGPKGGPPGGPCGHVRRDIQRRLRSKRRDDRQHRAAQRSAPHGPVSGAGWLAAYTNWFNQNVSSSLTQMLTGYVHEGLNLVVSDKDLAKWSDTKVLALRPLSLPP